LTAAWTLFSSPRDLVRYLSSSATGHALGDALIKTVIAHEPEIMAFLALFQRMIGQEVGKMFLLIGCEDARAASERAGAVKGCQNRVSNEL